jgi:alpha-aminoadipate/glutamate carrier protein LysW
VSNPALSPAACPVCDAAVALPASTLVSELIRCRACGSELEVAGLDPVELREAPVAEEDWGQ